MNAIHSALVVCSTLAILAPAQETRPRPARNLAAFLWHDAPNDLAALDGIRAALAASGLAHELAVHRAHSDASRATRILADLEASRCELVFALGTQAALLAKDRLHATPIVYTAVTNPVASGVVASWQGSGTNVCGASNWIPPESVLHVFRLAVPDLTRLGMLRSKDAGVVSAAELLAMREHVAAKGTAPLEIVEQIVESEQGIAAAVRTLVDAKVQAIWVPIDFTIYQNMARVREALGAARVPIVSSSLQGARNGAIAGVLVDYALLGKRTAVLALAILEQGRAPGSLPVDTMRGYQVLVNVAAARRAGYEVPLSLLALADLLIDEPQAKEARDGR